MGFGVNCWHLGLTGWGFGAEVLGALGGGAAALEAVLEMAADGDGEERRVL